MSKRTAQRHVRTGAKTLGAPPPPPNAIPEIIDGAAAPEVLVDGFTGASQSNGLVRINMHVDRFDAKTNKLVRTIILRLALTPDTLFTLSQGFDTLLEQMIAQGHISPPLGWIDTPKDDQ